MKKTRKFLINDEYVELDKEEIEEMLKAFDIPEFQLKMKNESLIIIKNGDEENARTLLVGYGDINYNMANISYNMAEFMSDLITPKQAFNKEIKGFKTNYDIEDNVWYGSESYLCPNVKIFATEKIQQQARDMLNEIDYFTKLKELEEQFECSYCKSTFGKPLKKHSIGTVCNKCCERARYNDKGLYIGCEGMECEQVKDYE